MCAPARCVRSPSPRGNAARYCPTCRRSPKPAFRATTSRPTRRCSHPAGTPKEIVDKLNAEIQKIIANPDAKARIAITGFDAFSGPPETLAPFVQSELGNWGNLLKDAGIEPQ